MAFGDFRNFFAPRNVAGNRAFAAVRPGSEGCQLLPIFRKKWTLQPHWPMRVQALNVVLTKALASIYWAPAPEGRVKRPAVEASWMALFWGPGKGGFPARTSAQRETCEPRFQARFWGSERATPSGVRWGLNRVLHLPLNRG